MKRNFTSKINENRPGYKETLAGWIPNDWDYVRARDITELSAGGTPSTSVDEYWGGDILWMRSGDLNLKRVCDVKGRITNKGLDNSSAFLIPKHSVLIGLAGQGKTRGTVAINEVELAANQSVVAFIPDKTKSHYLYIFYDLEHRYNELRRLSTGDGGRGGLNLNILGNLRFALPTLTEQQKIVEILTTWDKAIELVGKQIETKQRLKMGLMQQLLTGKIRFPGYSGNWHELRILSVAQVIMGQSPNSSAYNDAGLGLPLIQGNTDIKDRKTAPRMYTSEITKQCEIGDIILSVRAPVGETSWSLHEACIGRGVCAIRATKTDSKFLFYKLVFDESRWIRFAQGSTFKAINSKDIRNLSIWIPCSLSEQSHIASVFIAIDREIELLNKHVLYLRRQKQGLMQKLLTGEVPVKV